MGKYNLHSLGWKNFELLCSTVMQNVLSATYTPFSEGADAGRDGFYWGTVPEGVLTEASLQGKFAFQCKHTSKVQESFALSIVEKELPKVRKLVDEHAIRNYIIFTNYKVSAISESAVTKHFSEIDGLLTCIVLGEEWFETQIDANPILRRLVPRLYGIGDLSQILDERAREQSLAVLEDLRGNVDTFVSTRAYQDALMAIELHGFVVLLGPPSVGKSSIAATICMTARVENQIEQVYVFTRAEQFEIHWNPSETKCLYLFDDVFGATSLDHRALIAWTQQFRKLSSAIGRGNKIIFTSRHYIFSEALEAIKKVDFPILFHSQVVINVSDLTHMERTMILYNHVKCGNLPMAFKKELKQFLTYAAEHSAFTPELARRLGSASFTDSLQISKDGIHNFFAHPTSFFEEIIYTLDNGKKAALFLILLHNNQLPSPVADDSLLACIKSAYPAELADIRQSLDYMHGELVKHVRQSNQTYWSLHHPSMIDSLLQILSKRLEMVEIYLRGADFHTVVTNTTCRYETPHKIFIPDSLWPLLMEKLAQHGQQTMDINSAAYYVDTEGSDDFLHWLRAKHDPFLSKIMQPVYINLDYGACWPLSARLLRMEILKQEVHQELVVHIMRLAKDWGDFSSVSNPDLSYILGEEVEGLKQFLIIMGRDWFKDTLNHITTEDDCSPGDLEKLLDTAALYEILLSSRELPDEEVAEELEYIRYHIEVALDEFPTVDYGYQSQRVKLAEDKLPHSHSIFDDVDQ